jgi:RNA polymerase sigma-70 factor (ECF subfamily)
LNDVVNSMTSEPTRSGEADFEALIGPLVEPGLRLAYSMLGDRAEAEDATQEAIAKAWRRLPQLREPAQIRAWFFAIVANQCRNVRRGRWFKTIRIPEFLQPARPAEPNLEKIDIERGLARLSAADRQVLFMHFFLDLPVDEVAGVLGISPAAAKGRIYRACHRLRPDLLEEDL